MATKSLFFEITDKYLEGIIGRIVDKYNDKYTQEQYLHLTMLQEEYSADLIWTSAEFQNNIVAADVVSLSSSLPLKKRDKLSTATGQIPKIGISYSRSEKFLADVTVMAARGAREAEIAARVLADAGRVVNGIIVRTEILFQRGLSTGVILVEDANNPGLGVRADFGYLPENFFYVKNGKRWGEDGYLPLDDIEQLFDKANADGNSIALVLLSKSYFNKIRMSEQGKRLAAIFGGQASVQAADLMTPSRQVMLDALNDEYGCPFRIVDSSFRTENMDGTTSTIKPWEEANVVGVPSEVVGRLVYGTLAEETRPVQDVTYVKAGSHILVAEFGDTNPLREFTTGQALCLPVIDNARSIYVLLANKAGKVVLSKDSHDFPKSASSTTFTVNADSAFTVSVPETATWCTTSVSGNTVTVSVSANSASSAPARSTVVTVTDADGKYAEFEANQAANS